jgi:sterol desaturase/sphingolipid hydroxylase (fatty acid hydroxylase superfamily)
LFHWAQSDWFARQDTLKWVALIGAFFVCACWESFRPRRLLVAATGRRWLNHTLLGVFINSAPLWLLRLNGILVAMAVAQSPYGLLNRNAPPLWVRCVLTFLLLDFTRYAQHYLFHRIEFFWRIHRVHHSDPDFDWSTGFVFHPGEMLFTQLVYIAVIAVVAPPAIAVLALELAEAVHNFFVHANINISPGVDAVLRRIVITPDMHRIHHSDDPPEQNTNFGAMLPFWDHLFGTYLAKPAAGHEKMGVGLREAPRGFSLLGLLALPFRKL